MSKEFWLAFYLRKDASRVDAPFISLCSIKEGKRLILHPFVSLRSTKETKVKGLSEDLLLVTLLIKSLSSLAGEVF